MTNKKIVESIKVRAAGVHFRGGDVLTLSEGEFTAAFLENELTGQATKLGDKPSWFFYGLKVSPEQRTLN